jgi:hypothetical protein
MKMKHGTPMRRAPQVAFMRHAKNLAEGTDSGDSSFEGVYRHDDIGEYSIGQRSNQGRKQDMHG